MKFTITALLIFFIIFYSANAQTSIKKSEGKVILSGKILSSQTNAGLGSATIYFPNLRTGVASQSDGSFSINNIPAGKQLVEISSIGYKSFVDYIEIKGTTEKDFTLTPSIVENSGIVVTGTSSGTKIKNSPIPITVVNRADILKGSSTNIIDAISHEPGITQLTTGPAISKPYIRGLGGNRVLTISNGTRQEGQQWGDEHGIEVDDYNVDKVEILKGPASLMYGSDGLAGIINIISNTPILQGRITGNVSSNYQTNNGLYAYNGNIAGNINGFNWNAYGTYKAAHDYKNKFDGYVFNSKFNNTDLGGSVGINKSWGHSSLTYSRFDQSLGLIEGGRDAATGRFLKIAGRDTNDNDSTAIATDEDFKSYKPGIPRQRITHQKLVVDNTFYLPNGGGRIALIAGYQLNQRKEFPNISAPNEAGLYFHLRSITYDLKYFFPPTKQWQTTIGISGMQQQNKNPGNEFLIPAYSLFDIGGFVYTKKTINKLNLSGGVRYDNRKLQSHFLMQDGNIKFPSFKRNFNSASGSIGLAYDINNSIVAKVNISRGFRAPNISELAANGVHEGTIKYEYGNNALKPETSSQLDAGVDINTDHVSLIANVFYNHIQNYIFSRKLISSAGDDSIPAINNEENFAAFKYFQTTANLYGAEFMFDLHPHPLDWLHYKNTISYVRGKSGYKTDSTKNLPAIPATRWLSELQVEFKSAGKIFKNLYAKIETDVTFAQKNILSAYQTETATPGYTLLNAGMGADITNNKKKTLFSLYLSADNITDVAYQNHLSRLKYADENMVSGRKGVYNMGRNFSIKMNVPLPFYEKKQSVQ